MSVYLDHAATSPPTSRVLDYYRELLSEYSYNPSSAHAAGKKARALINESLSVLADCLGTSPGQVIVTSGGTESINLALRGYAAPRRFLPHILMSEGEHKAVPAAAKPLAGEGAAISYIPLDREGRPDIARAGFDPDHPPTLISVIWLSNETGAVTDLEQIAAWRNAHCPHAAIHVDAVQSAGKIPIHFERTQCDFLSVSGHKWGAPMGLGLLLYKDAARLHPLIAGAGQQGGLRSGTENAPLLGAAAFALKQAVSQLEHYHETADALKRLLLTRLADSGVPCTEVSPATALPHITTVAFPMMGETLARILSDEGIWIGRGAACSSGRASRNQALAALGVSDETVRQAVRVSFGPDNTAGDVEQLAEAVRTALNRFVLH